MLKFKPKAIPKKLGAVVDLLYRTRNDRLDDSKAIKAMEEFEKALKAHLIETLPKSEASGVAGKLASAKVVTKKIPSVEDWDKLYDYIKRHNAFDLLTRRINDSAVYERWDCGESIPGVGPFTLTSVSVTKL